MASVKVAVRVRPFNKREIDMDCKFIIQMHGKKTTITNIKMQEHAGDHTREINKDFSYDFSYWTVDKNESRYASQEEVFQDLGVDVIKSAYEGYNACVFAYGQTGSGKTYSMMGNPGDVGLIPRICQGLFAKMTDQSMTYRTEVSYLEIYNEKVRDLLKSNSSKTQHSLRVREHPKEGPYVQDLSKHIVQNFEDIKELMDKGNFSRTTASTNMNDVSSRSHAIFTIVFTQAKFSNDAPSETHSKIHLVDLAGSERADATGATGIRLKEGGSINKSLVTLGNVISALADISDKSASRKSTAFIPYRDSVLTWLLKDSLGGNSKTMMIAAISPADCNYAETLSTLRYANRAKNIINKPTVNEDGNVKIIRELREEISRLRMMLGGNIDLPTIPRVQEKLHENEARVKVLTEEWAGKWKEAANILKEDSTLALRKEGMGVILDSELPHLIGIDDDILSTGIMLYHLKEGKTRIGTAEAKDNLDIILQGLEMETEHCVIEHTTGEVVLVPQNDAQCMVNGNVVSDPTPLSQGAVILLGKTNMFRFNHPQQAQKLREEFKGSTRNLSASRMSLLSQSMSDLCRSTESLALATSGWEMEQKHIEQLEALEEKRQEIEDMEEKFRQAEQVRISEQSSKESELENKRLTLEDMQKKAEQIKHEAEKAQIEAKKENAKLKRRSMDIEKQMKEYIEEKEKFHVEREQERNAKLQQKDSEDRMIERYREEKSDMRKMIEEEMAALMTKEREHVEIAQGTKEKLLEELERLQQEHHQQRQHFEDSWKTLSQKEMEYEVKVQKASGNGSDHDILECEMEEELAKIDGERLQLENLRDDHQLFDKVISDLSTGTKEALAAERIKLSNFYDEVLKKEKHFYERYVAQKDGASSARSQEEIDIADKHEQLAADRIYIEDCENNYVKSVSETASLTPDARDQLEREKLAIEIEKERIAEEEEGLNDRKSKVQGTFDALLQEIEIQRSCDIDNLNKERQKLKDCKGQWHNVVEQEIERSVEKRTKVMQEFEEREKGASDNDNGIELISALEEQKTDLIGERKALEDKQRDSENEARRSISKINRMSTELDEKTKREIEKISTRMKALVELEAWESTKPTEYSIKQRQAAFEKYRTLKDEKSLEELLRVVEDELSCENSTLGGKGRETLEMERELLKTRMKDLHQLEDQLSKSEDELHSKRREFEDQRQKELDKIEVEKFNLQEMEHEERINALVEQEVKRRLLEERVQREKKRRMEREQDKVEREQEMFKLKKAHQKEIKRIKQFYENRDNSSVISENVPTRANPYASTLSGESMSRGGGNNSMVRAHSTPSLQTNSVANPIHVSLPSHMIRGSGFDSHVEFEVKLSVYNDSWTVFRRYTKFRDLHLELKNKYPEVSALVFPPKKWFGNKSEKVIFERRLQLESYLCAIVEALYRRSNSPLHPSNAQYYSKQLLTDFHPFFKKGMFESSKYATS